jgi:hypothetical protein
MELSPGPWLWLWILGVPWLYALYDLAATSRDQRRGVR